MKSAPLSEIKKELSHLSVKQLTDLCAELARYKKDNKDYLTYLVFEAHNKNDFLNELKKEIEGEFVKLDAAANLYYLRKGLRKILRLVTKYSRYLDDQALAAELHIHFLTKLNQSGIPFRKSQQLVNMYNRVHEKILSLVSKLHEDLQSDYDLEIEGLRMKQNAGND